MESLISTNYGRKMKVNNVLTDPKNVEIIRKIYRNIISKGFSIHQARFGARTVAIRLCKTSNIYTSYICEKNSCDFCILYSDIDQIIKE